MLRKEGQVDPYESNSELTQGQGPAKAKTREGGVSEVKPSEDSEYGPHREYIMEMCHYIVGIMENDIQRCIRKDDARKAP